ncbi:protein trichome birefringence-like 2 [Syzygium oleosum]|uniref:protein trichome birefringence-like 2 n=1 Tax=Syzygium oleosum TaxID=219896 RepID=UPI0024B9125B|nr:protein trichome birefringence-like 2 [Syzygium oleosum]
MLEPERMEPAQHAFSEQLLHAKRAAAAASKFGLSVGASLFFLGLVAVFTLSVTPLCLELSGSPVSLWPFSSPTSTADAAAPLVSSPAAHAANSTTGARSCCGNATSGVGQALSFLDGDGRGQVLNTTVEANVTREAETERVLGNPAGDSKNRSLTVRRGSFGVKTHEAASRPVDDSKARHDANLGEEAVVSHENHREGGNFSLERGGSGKSSSPVATEESNLRMARHGIGVVGIRGGDCDIFGGRWVRDDSKPYYPANSCPYVDRDFNCQLNGRPDDGFVKWKWQPNGCDMPSLNATDFLERLRGRRLVFVGDSLNRNMWESLVCILRHSVNDKNRVYEISGRREFKKKGVYAFRFEGYNCSVDFVGAPFLVRESSFSNGNRSFGTLRLDLMDRTTRMYRDADIIVFNTGHWWTHEKTTRGEHYYQEGKYVHPRLKVLEAYKRALTTWAKWIDRNIHRTRTQVFFRGYSVTHFRGGQWNSGGQCHKETEPIFNDTYLENYPSKMRVLEHVLQEMKTPVTYLNISRLTDYRKDGHPSVYRMAYRATQERIAAEQSQDCSHWCLPGVPDTWNELLYASLLKMGWGSPT